MYNAQLVIERVQSEIKRKKETQKHVLEACGLSENTLNKMTDKNGISSFNLAKIADYLDCSVDYLIGRTDNPDAHKNAVAMVSMGDLSNNSGIVGNVGSTINAYALDKHTEALVNAFEKLDVFKQAKVLCLLDELQK